MPSQKNMDMTTGSVFKKLIVFAFPILLSGFMQQFYHSADVMVVGRFADDVALAAVGATGQITNLLLNFFIGISAGTNILCAQARGAGDTERERRIISTSVIFGFCCGACIALFGCLFSPFLLDVIEVPEEIRGEAGKYMCIFLLGQPASMLYNFCASIFRARGNSKLSMRILLVTGAVNVGLNLIFVICFHWDAAGVALATIIANYLSVFAALYVLFRRDGEYCLNFSQLRFYKKEFIAIAKLGIPTGLNSTLFNISSTIVSRAANILGTTVVAAVSAANSVTNITHTLGNAFITATVSFAAQNYGAGKMERVDRLLKYGMALTQTMFVVINTVVTIFPDFFIGIFTNNPEIVFTGRFKLLFTSWGYHFYLGAGLINSCSRAFGKSVRPTILNIGCICLLRIVWVLTAYPLLAAGASDIATKAMWLYWCIPISWTASFVAQLIDYSFVRRKTWKKLYDEGKLCPEDREKFERNTLAGRKKKKTLAA